MVSLRFLVITIIFFSSLTTAALGQSKNTSTTPDSWIGSYFYTYTEGETQGGVVPVVEYVIKVSGQGDSLTAHFSIDGYQAYEDFSCTAQVSDNRIKFYFLKDLRDAERYAGVNKMKRGQLVGSLDKVMTRGRARFSYRDGAIVLRGVSRTPILFKKSR